MARGHSTAHSQQNRSTTATPAGIRSVSGDCGEIQPGQVRWGRVSASWLNHPDIDADGMAILAALSTYADRDGRCWPSQTTLANLLKRSRSWVNKAITRLAGIGLITVHDRWSANGGRLSSLYQLADQAPTGENSGDNTITAPVAGTNTPCSAERHKHQNPEHKNNTPTLRTGDDRSPESASEQAPPLNVPSDWQPAARDLDWAASAYPHIDVREHARLFALRCQAHGYRYRDIGAAWKAWVVEDASRNRAAVRPHNRATAPSGAQRQPDRQPRPVHPAPQRPAMAEATSRLDAWAAVAARLQAAAPVNLTTIHPLQEVRA